MNLSRAKMKVVVLRKEIRLLVFVLTDIKEKLVKVCYDTLKTKDLTEATAQVTGFLL